MKIPSFISRPFVSDKDSLLTSIVNYIPTEIIAAYLAISGFLKGHDEECPKYFPWVFGLLFIFTFLWTYLGVTGTDKTLRPPKKVLIQAIVATISFPIWVYAMGDNFFIQWINHETYIPCIHYDAVFGSIVLSLYTVAVPIILKIIPPQKIK